MLLISPVQKNLRLGTRKDLDACLDLISEQEFIEKIEPIIKKDYKKINIPYRFQHIRLFLEKEDRSKFRVIYLSNLNKLCSEDFLVVNIFGLYYSVKFSLGAVYFEIL